LRPAGNHVTKISSAESVFHKAGDDRRDRFLRGLHRGLKNLETADGVGKARNASAGKKSHESFSPAE